MINLEVMPCADCIYFRKIAQPDGTEQSEYVQCAISENNRADNLLQVNDKKPYCSKREKDNNE